MNTITMIVTDLDGTLLTSDKIVTDTTRQALKELKNRGIMLGIASGRSVEASLKFLNEWGIEKDLSFLIGMNGSTIYDMRQKQKEEYYLIDGETILDIVEHFKDCDVSFFAMQGNNRYVKKSKPETLAHAKRFYENEIEVDYDTFLRGKKFNKLLLFMDPKEMENVRKIAGTFSGENYVGIQTEKHLFEYFDSRINKGVGIEKVCQHFGVNIENVVAFGDSLNDKEMLEKVGMGIAMKNASDIIKNAANQVSEYTNEEDALAHFIDDFIQKKNPARLDKDANRKK